MDVHLVKRVITQNQETHLENLVSKFCLFATGIGAKDHWSLNLDQKDQIIEIKMIMIQNKKNDRH